VSRDDEFLSAATAWGEEPGLPRMEEAVFDRITSDIIDFHAYTDLSLIEEKSQRDPKAYKAALIENLCRKIFADLFKEGMFKIEEVPSASTPTKRIIASLRTVTPNFRGKAVEFIERKERDYKFPAGARDRGEIKTTTTKVEKTMWEQLAEKPE
jgi:hypothetical protein